MITGRMRTLLLALLLGLMALPALAVEPHEILEDPALEARAREISLGIRCLVCQNQTIDDSNAELARELRVLIRERLVAGDSDQQVKDFLVSRYGDFVLFTPPLKPATLLLWFGPFLLLALGAAVVFFYLRGQRRRPTAGVAALDPDERARLTRLLDETTDKDPKA